MKEVVRTRGHEHVSARHASTLELTSEDYLTPAGDCILGIEADRTPDDFDAGFVDACRDADATLTATLETDGYTETIRGRGHPTLEFTSSRSMVCRTSEYIDERTVMVGTDKAAADLGRDFVATLTDGAELTTTFSVE